jgi:hypothetical protein
MMKDFIAIDFETANPQRVSACALGYAKISNCELLAGRGTPMKLSVSISCRWGLAEATGWNIKDNRLVS